MYSAPNKICLLDSNFGRAELLKFSVSTFIRHVYEIQQITKGLS